MNRTEEVPPDTTNSFNSFNPFINSKNSENSETMPNIQNMPNSPSVDMSVNMTSILLFILIILVLLSFFNINVLTILGSSLGNLNDIFAPFIKQFLIAIGYSTGEVINKSADVTTHAAKLGIDIADGTIHNVGNLLKKSASDLESPEKPLPEKPPLDKKLNEKSEPEKSKQEVKPDSSENPIQKPITADKSNWCLVGEYANKRGCVAVTDSDKCLSGQIFPSQQMCLNPTLTP